MCKIREFYFYLVVIEPVRKEERRWDEWCDGIFMAIKNPCGLLLQSSSYRKVLGRVLGEALNCICLINFGTSPIAQDINTFDGC